MASSGVLAKPAQAMRSTPGGRIDRAVPGLWLLGQAVLLLALALGVSQAVRAQARGPAFVVPYTGTLKMVNDTNVLKIGYRENSPPFAFIGPGGKPVGYALELCELVVDEIIAELRKDIRVELRPVTPENRFDLVRSGEIDLECGSTINNVERRKLVAFSPTIFVVGGKLLVPRGSGIRSLRDLQGKTVVLTRGTVHAEAIPKLAERQKLAIRFVTESDHNQSFALLAAGKADAFINDDVQLYGMLAETKSASQFRVVGEPLTYGDYAIAFRKDDPEFAEVVGRAFAKLAGSREIVAIYEKWFLKPLPSGIRLNLPMSPHLEEVFRVQGLPSD